MARRRFLEYLLKSEPDSQRHEQIKADVQEWDVPTLLNKARITKQGKITRSALLLLGRDEASHYLSLPGKVRTGHTAGYRRAVVTQAAGCAGCGTEKP